MRTRRSGQDDSSELPGPGAPVPHAIPAARRESDPLQEPLDRVVLISADPLTRRSWSTALGGLGLAATVEEEPHPGAVRRRAGPRPDLVVVDVASYTEPDGPAFAAEGVVVVGPPDLTAVQAALESGARAYLLVRDRAPQGNGTVEPARRGPALVADVDGIARRLSEREIEIVQHVADGHTNIRIGRELQISPLTVKSHLSRIARRLGTTDRAHLVLLALRAGVVV